MKQDNVLYLTSFVCSSFSQNIKTKRLWNGQAIQNIL